MKIAIGLCGLLRCEKQSINNLKKIANFQDNTIDIFICSDKKTYWTTYMNINNNDGQEMRRSLDEEYLYSIYGNNLKDYLLINDYNEMNEYINSNLYPVEWIYKKNKCIELIVNYENKNNFKYDFVLLTRSDILFLKNINFKSFDSNKFYIEPHSQDYKLFDKNNISSNSTIDDLIKNGFNLFGYGHPNWYISNSTNLYKFTNKLIKLILYNWNHRIAPIHIFTFLIMAVYLENIDIIYNKDITPISILHCYKNINSDRSYKALGIPEEYSSSSDLLNKLKYSIDNDIIL